MWLEVIFLKPIYSFRGQRLLVGFNPFKNVFPILSEGERLGFYLSVSKVEKHSNG